jgi:hypothetical protein
MLGLSNWTGIKREAVSTDARAGLEDVEEAADVGKSLGSKRHKISLPFAKLLVKYVFWQHVAKLVAARERACCIAGTEEGPTAGPLPLADDLALDRVEEAEGEAGT